MAGLRAVVAAPGRRHIDHQDPVVLGVPSPTAAALGTGLATGAGERLPAATASSAPPTMTSAAATWTAVNVSCRKISENTVPNRGTANIMIAAVEAPRSRIPRAKNR